MKPLRLLLVTVLLLVFAFWEKTRPVRDWMRRL